MCFWSKVWKRKPDEKPFHDAIKNETILEN